MIINVQKNSMTSNSLTLTIWHIGKCNMIESNFTILFICLG